MARTRVRRIAGPAARFALVVLAAFWAARFLFGTIASDGLGPPAVFALLIAAMAAALLWRATLDVRRAVRRLRA
jgi:hypothetical protein